MTTKAGRGISCGLCQGTGQLEIIQVESSMIDISARRIVTKGEILRLPPVQWDLLLIMLKHQGRYVSRKELSKVIYGSRYLDINEGRAISVVVHRLRKSLRGTDIKIETEHGLGYAVL